MNAGVSERSPALDSWKFIGLAAKDAEMLWPGAGRRASPNKRFQYSSNPVSTFGKKTTSVPTRFGPGRRVTPSSWGGWGPAVTEHRLCCAGEVALQEGPGLALASLWLQPLGSKALRRVDVKGWGREGLGPESAGQSWVLLLNGATLTKSRLHLKFQVGDKGWSPKGSQGLC